MPASPKVIDIDALLADHRKKLEAERKFVKVKLFGREWRITNQINNFMALRASEGDVEAFTEFLLNCTHEEEREDFKKALYHADMLDGEGLIIVINQLMEAVSGNPTKSSSGSSRSGRTQAVKRKSADT